MAIETIFNKYYMCHFGDNVDISNELEEYLQRIWHCQFQSAADVKEICAHWLDTNPDAKINEDVGKQLLCDVIQLVLLFVQHNFTGPFTHLDTYKDVLKNLNLGKEYNFSIKLSENGEEVNANTQLGEFLLFAKQIMQKLLTTWPNDFYLNWWHLRIIVIQQQILDDLTSNLYACLKSIHANLSAVLPYIQDAEEYALLSLELSNAFLLFHRTLKSELLLANLCQHLSVELHVEGLLGMRTKFQQKPLPQLCLQVKRQQENLPTAFETLRSIKLPQLLLLEDTRDVPDISKVSHICILSA